MKDIQKTFRFANYGEYIDNVSTLREILQTAFVDDNAPFMLAVDEAVCNTAKHTAKEQDGIVVEILLTTNSVTVTVKAKTCAFDALEYREKLLKIVRDPKFSFMDWGDFVDETETGMGIWYMLTGVDYLVIDRNGDEVSLSAKTPHKVNDKPETQMGKLIPRFLVRDKGVIS